MRAISIPEPWATMIAIGAKRFSVRSWRPDYRGPLAIHVSRRYPRRLSWIAGEPEFRVPLQRAGIWVPSVDLVATLGHVIAIAELIGCYRCEDVGEHCGIREGTTEHALDKFAAGRFAWKLDKVRRLLNPFRCAGTKTFFFVPDALVTAPALGVN